MQEEGLVIIYNEYKANSLFKTSIYLLEVVKVGKAVIFFFLHELEFYYIKWTEVGLTYHLRYQFWKKRS